MINWIRLQLCVWVGFHRAPFTPCLSPEGLPYWHRCDRCGYEGILDETGRLL